MTFRGTRIIDTRRGIDPTEIYRDEVASFFFESLFQVYNILRDTKLYKIPLRRRRRRKEEQNTLSTHAFD